MTAAAITAGASLVGTGLQIFGGGKSPAQRKKEIMRLQQEMRQVQAWLDNQIRAVQREADDMSLQEARRIARGGFIKRVPQLTGEWIETLSNKGISNQDIVIERMRSEAKRIFRETARRKVRSRQYAKYGMGALSIAGGGYAAWSLLTTD